MSNEILEQIATFVRARFRVPDDDPAFSEEVHLFEEGYIDSAGLVELVGHLEVTYEISLPDDVLTSDDFTTLKGIATVVSKLRQRAA